MKLHRSLLAAATLAVATLATPAQARPFAEIYTDCGLGGMLFPDTNWAAVVSNITWDWGTTAILSDASSAENCKGGKAKTAVYILNTYAMLEQDLARGEGQYLDGLMATAGCAAPAQFQIKRVLRDDLATRAAAPEYGSATRLDNAKAMLETLGTQAAACTI